MLDVRNRPVTQCHSGDGFGPVPFGSIHVRRRVHSRDGEPYKRSVVNEVRTDGVASVGLTPIQERPD